ncbi:MAG: flavodoxin reductase [Cyclobacteriaceae bacterium]
MPSHNVKIKSVKKLTHDVLQIITEKPSNFEFKPGQATEVAIKGKSSRGEESPFCFSSLPTEDHLEFVIKTYPERDGLTDDLLEIRRNDELILHEVFSSIVYEGEGIFIAEGVGITPFISILRELGEKNEVGNNKLIFANKTKADIILEQEFKELLGKNFINILSEDKVDNLEFGLVTESFLKKHIDASTKYFYVCGSGSMTEDVRKYLTNLGIEEKYITTEIIE